MNCPACNKNLASTLSVCPSCGTMVNDSVREELALKISPISKTPKVEISKIEFKEKPTPPAPIETPALPMVNKPMTAEIRVKQTVPTLVDFPNKNTVLPEWRLQLQNSVRMRNERGNDDSSSISTMHTVSNRTTLNTNGATALKIEPIEKLEPMTTMNPLLVSNPTLAKAMQRIEQSRQKYFVDEQNQIIYPQTPQPAPKSFPYSVVNKQENFVMGAPLQTSFEAAPIPQTVAPSSEPKVKFDTNKLPSLPKHGNSIEKPSVTITKVDLNIDDERDFLEIHKTAQPDVVAYAESQFIEDESEGYVEIDGEIDDCAPISLRFNSAIFDIIIGSFTSLFLLSPFMLLNGKFFSIEGLFAFLATCSIVMFIYLTTTIGFMGKTLGMKLFSLEIIDVEENEYPTLHQAAVSSAVYLLSLALGGLGFLTLLLNSEKRAAHDLISGTIIVKEYHS